MKTRGALIIFEGHETRVRADLAENAIFFDKGVRGKYAKQYHQGSNVVVLAPDVAKRFPNSEAVNQALRSLARIQGRGRLGKRKRSSARRGSAAGRR